MTDTTTVNVANFIDRMGINISAISRGTGIPDGVLRRSIVRKERNLRSDEFMAICDFIQRDPFEFYRPTCPDEPRSNA